MKSEANPINWLLGVVLAGAMTLLGCNSSPPSLAEVVGQVVCDELPLPGASVVLTPDRDRGTRGPISWGRAGADGRFTLQADGRPGAVVGYHRVSVCYQPSEPIARSVKLPARRYRQPDTSGLKVEVRAGQTNELILRLVSGE